MKRVIKPHEVRRNELIDTAQSLFSEKGYGATPVSEIIEAAGIAKGTFYHYFKSKEDLLDQLVERFTSDIDATLNRIMNNSSLNGLEKFNQYFAEVATLKMENKAFVQMLIQIIYKPENTLLRQKMTRRAMEIIIPKLELVLEQGSTEGVFDIRDPHETAEQIMMLVSSVGESSALIILNEKSSDSVFNRLEQKYTALETTVERILRAPERSIGIVGKDILLAFVGN